MPTCSRRQLTLVGPGLAAKVEEHEPLNLVTCPVAFTSNEPDTQPNPSNASEKRYLPTNAGDLNYAEWAHAVAIATAANQNTRIVIAMRSPCTVLDVPAPCASRHKGLDGRSESEGRQRVAKPLGFFAPPNDSVQLR
jgi:hypothetical protein